MLPAFGPIERVCVVLGNVQPFGHILSVAFVVFVAGLLDVVFLSTTVAAVASV